MTKKLIAGETLYFDARYIRVGHHDGISRYSAGLISALHPDYALIAIICDLRQLDHLPDDINYVVLNDPTNPIKELAVAFKLNRLGAKLVYSPMQTMGSLGRRYRLVLTLHDLIYYRHPKPPSDLNWLIKLGWRLFHLSYLPQRIFLNRADLVVTVSETTRKLMIKHILTKRPIRVVYNAGSNELAKKQREKPKERKTLIYMGSFMDYKNVETLVRGMALLPDFELIMLSRVSKERKAQLMAIAGGAASRIEFLNGVSDIEYRNLLDYAFALVSASFDEGFGIPVIESMQRGTPVVISDIEIFREIAGDAAAFFEPNSPTDFAGKVRGIDNPDIWRRLSKKSITRADFFDWQHSAAELLQALDP